MQRLWVIGWSTMSLRSRSSKVGVLVTFISHTKRPVSVWWINFKGQHVKYCELHYGNRLPIRTYETHPWVFTDALSGDRMVTSSGDDVYWPSKKDGREQQYVFIRIPVFSLRERTLQVVRQSFSSDEVLMADIPQSLKEDYLASTRPQLPNT